MADFTRNSVADMAAGNPGLNMGTSGSLHETDRVSDELWQQQDDDHWRERYGSRPYAQADRSYAHHQPAFRFGHEAAHHHRDREWRDAWDRVRGQR